MKDIGGWPSAHRTDFNAVQVDFTFRCCIVHYTQCPGQACVVSKQTPNHTVLNPNKQERKKIHIAKDPLGCLEGLLKHWEAEDERPACLHLTNKTSVIFIGNKYLIM